VKVPRQLDRGENVRAIPHREHVTSANVPGNNVVVEGLDQTVVV
jgi:hypothetical protein